METSTPKIQGYFCNFQKLPKVSNLPISENSPNLVTLTVSQAHLVTLLSIRM
jgi:hypothetical protein